MKNNDLKRKAALHKNHDQFTQSIFYRNIRPNNNIYKMHSLNKWHKKRHHKDRNANHTIKLLIYLKTINFFH